MDSLARKVEAREMGKKLVSKNVRIAMILDGVSVGDLARITGYTRGHVSAVLNGRQQSTKLKRAIALALNRRFEDVWEK